MASEIRTATLAGQTLEIGERSEFEPLQAWVRTVEDGDLPKRPESDSLGHYPAVPSARASLARKIIRRRKTAGWTQADLPRRAGIRAKRSTARRTREPRPMRRIGNKTIRVLKRKPARSSWAVPG